MYRFENYTENKEALLAGMDHTKAKIMELEKFGIDVSESVQKIENAKKIVQNDKISIVLVGAFSDGKTSVAAGWLNEKMDNMKIDSDESSDEILCYEPSSIPEGCQIVDTPGLFGNKEGNDENGGEIKLSDKTKKYISEANMILYVVPAKNPIKDSHKEFIRTLLKDMNKLATTIFVINRMDDVADLTDEEDFALQERIKMENVRSKLLGCNLTEAEAQSVKIACISAAPGGKDIELWKDYREEYLKRSHLPTLERLTNEVFQQSRQHLITKTGCDVINVEINKLLMAIRDQAKDIALVIPEMKDALMRRKADLKQLETRLLNSKKAILEDLKALERRKLSAIRAATVETFSEFLEDEIGTITDQFGYRLNDDINDIFEMHCQNHTLWATNLGEAIQQEQERQSVFMQTLMEKGAGAMKGAGTIGVPAFKKGIFAGRDLLGKMGTKIKFKPWQVTKMANFATKALPLIGAGIEIAIDITKGHKERKKQREFEQAKDSLKQELMQVFKDVSDTVRDNQSFFNNYAPEYAEFANQISEAAQVIVDQEKLLTEFATWEKNLSGTDLAVC